MKNGGLLFLILFFLGAFVLLTGYMISAPVPALDKWAGELVLQHRSAGLTAAMHMITFLGSQQFLLPAYILLIIFFAIRHKHKRALNIFVVGVSGTTMLFALKAAFERPRPAIARLAEATGFSYPSGHAFSSFLFFGLCAWLVWRDGKTKRWLLIAVLLCAPVLIAYSRVYLGVHFASDVLAGFTLSVLWLALSLLIIRFIRKPDAAVATAPD